MSDEKCRRVESCEIPDRPTDPTAKQCDIVPDWPRGTGEDFSGKLPQLPENIANIDDASVVCLMLPQLCYAIAGEEFRLYFDNLILLPDKSGCRFEVFTDGFGKNCGRYWSFTPATCGRFPLKVRVSDPAGRVIGEAETMIQVSAADAGNERNITMMMIGDSLFAGCQSAATLFENMRAHGNENFRLVGSHSGGGRPLEIGKPAVEAYGGWTWQSFLEHYDDTDLYNSKSKFLRIAPDGEKIFDFQWYLDRYNKGQAPDIIIFFLGCNDIALGKMDTLEEKIRKSEENRAKLLGHIRKVAPDALTGIVTLGYPNCRESAFWTNYKDELNRQQYLYNQHHYVKRTLQFFRGSEEVSLIPVYQSLDSLNHYPEDNAVHPNPDGYAAIGRSIECWLKAVLS